MRKAKRDHYLKEKNLPLKGAKLPLCYDKAESVSLKELALSFI